MSEIVKMKPEEITKEWLIDQYITQGKTCGKIMVEFGLPNQAVLSSKIDEWGIPRKKKGRGSIDSTNSEPKPKVEKVKEEIPSNEVHSFFIGEEEFKVRDRVRLGETINGVKETNLCEIQKIHKTNSGEIKVDLLTVMNHQKLTVLTSKLTLV